MAGTAGTQYNDPIYLQGALLLDSKWGPYNSTDEAKAAFEEQYRCLGLFQIINTPTGAQLYWYQNGTTDDDLVPFQGNSSVQIYSTKNGGPPDGFPLIADATTNVIYIAKDTATAYYFDTTNKEYKAFSGTSSVEIYPSKTGSTPGIDSFPTTGVANIIYVADDTNIAYIWNGTDYEALTGVGKSIVSVERTSGDGSPGSTDTYTITYSDGTTYNFNIYNGTNGLDGDKYSTTTFSVFNIQGSGTLTLTTNDLNLDYIPAQEVIISLDSSTYMIGLVDSYDKTTGVMVVTITSGIGDGSGITWYVNLNGTISIKGDTGDPGAQGEIGFPGFLYDSRRVFANQYTVGEIIYYSGQYYICISNNDAIVPVGAAIGVYWNPYSFEGDAGNGIDNIVWTSSTGGGVPGIPGATDTYTVTYTDTTSDTFVVYNGADGDNTGGTPTLQEVLTEGNTATDIDISLIGTSKITFDNGSKLKKGTTDSGNGGAGGIALICSLDYELKWEEGRLYVMQQNGTEIREVRYTLTATPLPTDDVTKGFVSNSRWVLDNGDTYICTGNTEGAATWVLQDIAGGISYYTAREIDNYQVDEITDYSNGDIYLILFLNANTGISSINGEPLINSKTENTLLPGDIHVNETHLVVYNGSSFQVLTIGGGGSINGAAGGDLSGTYPNPTVDGLQGNPVSNTTPTIGQVLQFDGTYWIPGAIPTGGSGGGGIVYYFNYGNTTSISPTTGLPTSPVAPSQLGITYNPTSNSIDSANLTQGAYTRVCSFVTIVGTPGVTTIPAGLWDFNIWADVVGNTGNSNQTQFQIRVYKYNGSTTPILLAPSDDIFIYDPTIVAQYIGNVTMPQTTILSTDRIYIEFWAQKNVSQSRQISFHFGTDTPSHVRTTIPSVSGTGLVKVVSGVYQNPASTLVDADVSASAAIAVTKLASGTADQVLRMSTVGSPTIGWGAIDISKNAAVTGTLPVGNGGTGVTTFGGIYTLLYTSTANSLQSITTANSSVLITNSSGAPSWSTTLPAVSGSTLTLASTGSLTLGTVGAGGATGQIIFRNSANVNTVTLQSGVTSPSSYSITLPTVAPSGAQYLQSTSSGGELRWASGTTTGVNGMGALDGATKDAKGAVITGSTLYMQTADVSNPGLVTALAQTFGGVKTFTSPSITTSLTTLSTTFSLLDSNATTITFGGEATSLTIGNAVPTTGTKTLNIGTGINNGNAATVVNIGSEQLLSSSSSAINLRNFTYLHPGSTTVGPPAFSSRTVGTRLVFSNVFITNSKADYAMGMGSNFLWSGIPLNDSTNSFKWYGGEKEIMNLDGNGTLKLFGEGAQLPKSHSSSTPPSTGNKYLLAENIGTGAVWWENGINYGGLSVSTVTNPAGSTLFYQNTYIDSPVSGGSNPSMNFINSGGFNGSSLCTGQFNFFVPDSQDNENTDVGYGKGFFSPTFSFIRKLTNNSFSSSGIVISAPRRTRSSGGKNISNITRGTGATANIITITLDNVTNLVVNQQAGISGINPTDTLYNGYSGRILSIDSNNNQITMYFSSAATTYTNGGTLSPIYREENGGYSNLYFAFEKDADFVAGTSAPYQGTPEETRILWYSTGLFGSSGSVGVAPFYGLFTNSVKYLNNNAPVRKLLTEKITFAAHSTNISVGEAVTGGSLNLLTFSPINNAGFAGGTRTINIGTVSSGTSFPSASVATNINIGTSVIGLFTASNTIIFGNVGFYGTSAQSKPTVSGAKAGNAALTSLCTALANLGLITNSTT